MWSMFFLILEATATRLFMNVIDIDSVDVLNVVRRLDLDGNSGCIWGLLEDRGYMIQRNVSFLFKGEHEYSLSFIYTC